MATTSPRLNTHGLSVVVRNFCRGPSSSDTSFRLHGRAVVAGGSRGNASGERRVVAGGSRGTASGESSMVVGGSRGTAGGVVAGGSRCTVSGESSMVAGGSRGTAGGVVASCYVASPRSSLHLLHWKQLAVLPRGGSWGRTQSICLPVVGLVTWRPPSLGCLLLYTG